MKTRANKKRAKLATAAKALSTKEPAKPKSKKKPSSSTVENDRNKPKKPPTAYFLEDFRKTYQQENPGVKSMCDIGKACGEKWKTMSFEMFRFGKRKSTGKEKVVPRDNSTPSAPRSVTNIRIIERQTPPPAHSSHIDIVDLETQLSEQSVKAPDSVEPSNQASSNRAHKAYLQPDGNLGFVPSKPATTAVTKVLQHRYTDAWMEGSSLCHETDTI